MIRSPSVTLLNSTKAPLWFLTISGLNLNMAIFVVVSGELKITRLHTHSGLISLVFNVSRIRLKKEVPTGLMKKAKNLRILFVPGHIENNTTKLREVFNVK